MTTIDDSTTGDVTGGDSGAPAPISAVPGASAPEKTSRAAAAVVGPADAGTPRAARESVSAQHAKAEIPRDPIDETIITRRRRTAWSLIRPTGGHVPITADVVILGRKPDADRSFPTAQLVSIDDGTVSKTHARLELRDEQWYVTDLGSTNGVLFATLMGHGGRGHSGRRTGGGGAVLSWVMPKCVFCGAMPDGIPRREDGQSWP